MSKDKSTLLASYLMLKERYPDCIVMYQVGEFFEILFEDAKMVSGLLNLTLTKRGETPMCGVPKKHVETYAAKLTNTSMQALIYAQVNHSSEKEDKPTRSIVRFFTPGTLMESEYLPEFGTRYLASIYGNSVAWADISTGLMLYNTPQDVQAFLTLLNPHETITMDKTKIKTRCTVQLSQHWFERECPYPDDMNEEERKACNAIVNYTTFVHRPSEHGPKFDLHLQEPARSGNECMNIDGRAVEALEIFTSKHGKSLFDLLITHASTPMGKRLIKSMLLTPSINTKIINERLNNIEALLGLSSRNNLNNTLIGVRDFERAMARIASKKGTAQNLVTIKSSMRAIMPLNQLLKNDKYDGLHYAPAILKVLEAVMEYGDRIIDPKSEPLLRKMHETISSFDASIAKMEAGLRRIYGASSLKICNNVNLGYYIEIHNKDFDKIVGDDLVMRVKLANCTRYSTAELSELEKELLHAKSAIDSVEKDVMDQLFDALLPFTEAIFACASSIATIDSSNALAQLAEKNGYVRPEISDKNEFYISSGMHPILLDALGPSKCHANDSEITGTMVITAPNMSGKSVFLKQNALLAYMVHVGLFVPVSKAKIGKIDRIFCRIGADDNMSAGYSTFMQEMVETAEIVNNATSKSLVIIDELGRGTSTRDGVAIARSVIEYLHNEVGCRTIIATHYHELTDMVGSLSKLFFYTFELRHVEGKIIFSHKLKHGVCKASYGIAVAQAAGMRKEVIRRAKHFYDETHSADKVISKT